MLKTKKFIKRNNKTKKYIIKGGASATGTGTDYSSINRELNNLNAFSIELYNNKKNCFNNYDNDFQLIYKFSSYEKNINNFKSNLELEKIIKYNFENKPIHYKIKISNPDIHGSIYVEQNKHMNPTIITKSFDTVPDNCIICFNTLLNRAGYIPYKYAAGEYFSFNKYIKNMRYTEFNNLLTYLSGYSDINNVTFENVHVYNKAERILYNNCFLDSMWYFPGQKYPKTLTSTDKNSCEYSKTFSLGLTGGKYKNMTQLEKKKLNYDRRKPLIELIDNLSIKSEHYESGTKVLNIFFFNTCRGILDIKHANRGEIITYYMKYEYYLHQINLKLSKSILRNCKIRPPPKINYGDTPYCASKSRDYMSINYDLNDYYDKEFLFNKNYCYNRVNIFLKRFYELLCLNIKLIETKYKNELIYFMSLSIIKQIRFIKFIEKNLSKEDYSYFMCNILFEIDKYKWGTYHEIIPKTDRVPNYTFELDYMVELCNYLHLFAPHLETGNFGNKIIYLNKLIVNVPLYSNINKGQNLFICGDITGATKAYYNTNRYDFLYFLLEKNMKRWTNIRNLTLLNIENLRDKMLDLGDKLYNIKVLYIKYNNYEREYNINFLTDSLTNFLVNHAFLEAITLINIAVSSEIIINCYNFYNLEHICIKNKNTNRSNIIIEGVKPSLKTLIMENTEFSLSTSQLLGNSIKLDKLYLYDCIINDNIKFTIREDGMVMIKNMDFTRYQINIEPENYDNPNTIKIISEVEYKNVIFREFPTFKTPNGNPFISHKYCIHNLTYDNCVIPPHNTKLNKFLFNDTIVINLIIKNTKQCQVIELKGRTMIEALKIENCVNLLSININNIKYRDKYLIKNLIIINCPKLKIDREVYNKLISAKYSNIPLENVR